jgi:hypothetical protein
MEHASALISATVALAGLATRVRLRIARTRTIAVATGVAQPPANARATMISVILAKIAVNVGPTIG